MNIVFSGLSDLKKKPKGELDEFQRALLTLESCLGSQLNVAAFARECAERNVAAARTVNRLVREGVGNKPYGQKALEAVLDITQTIQQGGNTELESRLGTGLVSLDTFPDLMEFVERLHFRSDRAAFNALEEATDISYLVIRSYFPPFINNHPVHVGKKEVRDQMKLWLSQADRGVELGIDPKYTGLKKSAVLPEMMGIIQFLVTHGAVRSKEAFIDRLGSGKYNRNTIANSYLGGKVENCFIPVGFYQYFMGLFTLYSITDSYEEGDLLSLHTDNELKPIEDLGFVETKFSNHSVLVNWKYRGKRRMAHNGPYDSYDSKNAYDSGEQLFNPNTYEYGVVTGIINKKQILVSWEEKEPVVERQNERIAKLS